MPIKTAKRFWMRERYRGVISALTAGAIAVGYVLTKDVAPGWASYFTSLPALVGVLITVLARVNDLGPDKIGWHWQIRRVGLTMVGATAAAFMYSPFSESQTFVTWLGCFAWWGFFLTWLTTPSMPPWHKYVFGDADAVENVGSLIKND